MLTFQIGLHINDLFILEYIKNKLNCSLLQILLPIFNFTKLNSSKYHQFILFEKVINFIKDKKHLSKEGKLEMIKFYHEMKKPYLAPLNKNTHLTIHWLGGFTDLLLVR